MIEPRLTPRDELRLYIEEQLARIRQQGADADRKTQEIAAAPRLWRVEIWKLVIAALAAVGIISGALGYKLGSTPPAPIVIQLPPAR
jgi:anti-sigma-K factor RskA